MHRDPRTKSGKIEKDYAKTTPGYKGLKNGFHLWETEQQAKSAAPGKRVFKINP